MLLLCVAMFCYVFAMFYYVLLCFPRISESDVLKRCSYDSASPVLENFQDISKKVFPIVQNATY